jgi:hypothetical protein
MGKPVAHKGGADQDLLADDRGRAPVPRSSRFFASTMPSKSSLNSSKRDFFRKRRKE